MKKFLCLLLASSLILGACGNKEESKSEDKKETKSSDKESKKKDKEKENKKSNYDKEENKNVTENNNTQEQQNTQEITQTQEQVNTQEQQPIQSQEQAPVLQEPTDQEKMEANAKVAKEHGYTGIPNGDAGLLEPADEYYSNDQLDPDTGLPMDDAVPHKTGE